MKAKISRQYLYDIVVVLLFALISFAYFFPADMEGKILYRHDSSAGRGAGSEIDRQRKVTGKTSRWTNALFSGMPTYQTSPSYSSARPLSTAVKAYHLWLPDYVWYVFVYLLGFYILLRAFDFRWYLAMLGAVVWAFSSYFFIIIAAGHIWKVMALAYLPPMIAGIVTAYQRGRYLTGLAVTALFAAFEINANHVQMTYYYLFIILFMVIGYLIDAVRKHRMKHFLKATAACAGAAVIAVCLNLPNLYHTWSYSQETMRGKSELVKENTSAKATGGLERDYITQWSYGIDETWTLLIPNAKGGASAPLTMSDKAMDHADGRFTDIYRQLSQYWGNQPMTAGPVYAGAFVMMLFFLGLFIVRGPVKWALYAATVLSVLLSWGKNFMPLTDFFIDYVPMYAKFRTVASILVIAEFTIPLLAMLALKEMVTRPELFKERETLKNRILHFIFFSPLAIFVSKKWGYLIVAFLITAGVCVLFAVMPGTFFDFVSVSERHAMRAIPAEYLTPLLANLTEMRQAVFVADCRRSAFVILIGTVLLLLVIRRKIDTRWGVAAMIVLCLIDMWQVNKRYLNNDMFVNKSVRDTPPQPSKADEMIMQDTSDCGNYRVLNMAGDTFNENETSYFHKSIGGYHAAKLRRYQELITAHLHPEMRRLSKAVSAAGGDMTRVAGDTLFPVLDMLNMRYVILPLSNGEKAALRNPYAQGNAWYADKVTYVNNANEELDALGTADLRHEAVADASFADILGESLPQTDGTVTITHYMADELTYTARSGSGGVIVFSEIYYPGWTATVDGKPADIGRVNYVLRAIRVDAGEHEIRLTFHPRSVTVTETIAYAAYALLIIVIAVAVIAAVRRKKSAAGDITKVRTP